MLIALAASSLLGCVTAKSPAESRANAAHLRCYSEAVQGCGMFINAPDRYGRCIQRSERGCMREEGYAYVRGRYVEVKRTDAKIADELEKAAPR